MKHNRKINPSLGSLSAEKINGILDKKESILNLDGHRYRVELYTPGSTLVELISLGETPNATSRMRLEDNDDLYHYGLPFQQAINVANILEAELINRLAKESDLLYQSEEGEYDENKGSCSQNARETMEGSSPPKNRR